MNNSKTKFTFTDIKYVKSYRAHMILSDLDFHSIQCSMRLLCPFFIGIANKCIWLSWEHNNFLQISMTTEKMLNFFPGYAIIQPSIADTENLFHKQRRQNQ